MNDRPQRYGRPAMSEDPVKDAVEAHQASIAMQLRAFESVADSLDRTGDTALADQIRQSCIVIREAGDSLWGRIRKARSTEEVSA